MYRARPTAPDMPLFAWGDALRAARMRRRRLSRWGMTLGVGVIAIAATIVAPPAPRLVWNASASAPIGLYSVHTAAEPATGDTVIAWLPARFRLLAATRRYLPRNVPLVKRVAAGDGDEICALGKQIFINGEPTATRRRGDGSGRPMPWWDGCARLGHDRFFLLMTASPDSFDGRYFGPTSRAEIVGTARLIWSGQ